MSYRRVRVTTRRSTAIVRKGQVVEIEWTPNVQEMADAGRITILGDVEPSLERALPARAADEQADPDLGELSKDQLIARAAARGVEVAKSWTKPRIAKALEEAE